MVNCNMEYPYPVLRPEAVDYKTSCFAAEVKVTPGKSCYIFHTKLDIQDEKIKKLVEDGLAQPGINIQCDSTWLREMKRVNIGEDEFSISTSDVHNRVNFCPVITATTGIDNFYSDDFIDEFQGMKITIHPGDPLAIGEARYFDAEYVEDHLKKGDPIISITSAPDTKDMSFDFEGSVIKVFVPEKCKNAYYNMKVTKEKYPVLSILFYLPAVTEGLRCLKEDEDTYINYTWAKTIKDSVMQLAGGDENKYEALLDSPFQTAQSLVGGMDNAILKLESWIIN